MAKRLKHEVIEGPDGEVLKISWMPGRRVRLDFSKCGRVSLTKVFPPPGGQGTTHVEFNYEEANSSGA